MIDLNKDELQDYIKNYIIDNLTIRTTKEHGYYQEMPDTRITVYVDGEEVTSDVVDGN